jgi:hypothetical protein
LEVDVQQGNFKILRLLPQVLILFLVEKWILPNRSETVEIGQKTEGILGVKVRFTPKVKAALKSSQGPWPILEKPTIQSDSLWM